MNKGQKLIASLLALCAVLLTLNLVMQVEPQAQAQVQAQASIGLPDPPVVVAGMVLQDELQLRDVYRFWSNGAVDYTRFNFDRCNGVRTSCFFDLIGACHDLDGDGTVGVLDLLALLADWGPCV